MNNKVDLTSEKKESTKEEKRIITLMELQPSTILASRRSFIKTIIESSPLCGIISAGYPIASIAAWLCTATRCVKKSG